MICLALDTATEACSAALRVDGELYQRYELAPRRHAELILPMVDAVLKDAGCTLRDCDLLAFGRGPGAFTGLRIAAGVAQGLAFSHDLPVAPVSDLAALALRAARSVTGAAQVAAALDARMGEVYWAVFASEVEAEDKDEAGAVLALTPEQVCVPDAVVLPPSFGPDWIGAGSGWAAHRESLCARLAAAAQTCVAERLFADCYPRAAEIAQLGERLWRAGACVDALQARPVYLRDRVTDPV